MENRVIKFRAWDGKKMNYNPKIGFVEGVCNYSINDYFANLISENNYTYMQFTGLKDKDGKEIYEGDLMKHISFPKRIVKVYFKDGCFMCGERLLLSYEKAKKYEIPAKSEVIGNIFENNLED